jgi:hypothetical protein
MTDQRPSKPGNGLPSDFGAFAPAIEYFTDAAQRAVLFFDVMRQRGNAYREHAAQTAPHVLEFKVELIIDGRTLERPVNYGLVRVIPPEGVEIDPTRRPFVVVDPRAGHGPGIGGFKSDSEIGVVFKAGHPCYFIGFLPEPMPGQTIEDIGRAEAIFLEKVIALHPQAEGKPCVIGNCQAGWAVMMLAAVRPELFGPIIVAGSPLQYWAGVHGKNPMRYSGGLLGGSWLTALASDLGGGKFDGAGLVQNFENQNPSNTLWSKQYNLYSKIDTEASRYLGFERWWGGHVNLNAEEIQFIVDQLFIGNNLASGKIQISDGTAIDFRSIRSPIIVFCSQGDNITPPQQALGWILDLYDSVDEIRSYGQTIVYTIHETIGHLGIFVSAGVARKEYGEFSSNIDLIDTLPPGLYEAVFTKHASDTANPDLVSGEWVMRCEARTLDDIRALGGNDLADDLRFETAARVSNMNLAFYRTYMQPFVRAMVNTQMANWLRQMHPLRLQYEMFSNANPLMAQVSAAADRVRAERKPVSADNPFLAMQETVSKHIVSMLDSWRDASESLSERAFLSIYGSPALQRSVGLDPEASERPRRANKSPMHAQFVQRRIGELRERMSSGGLREALVRATIYVGMARGSVDERGFEAIRRFRLSRTEASRLTLAEFKALVREQFFMLLIDQKAALDTIAALLPNSLDERRKALKILHEVISAAGDLKPEVRSRLDQVSAMFETGPGATQPQSNVSRIPVQRAAAKSNRTQEP